MGSDSSVLWHNMGSWLAGLLAFALLAVSSAQHIPLTFPYGVASGTIPPTQIFYSVASRCLLPCQSSARLQKSRALPHLSLHMCAAGDPLPDRIMVRSISDSGRVQLAEPSMYSQQFSVLALCGIWGHCPPNTHLPPWVCSSGQLSSQSLSLIPMWCAFRKCLSHQTPLSCLLGLILEEACRRTRHSTHTSF